MSPTIRPATPQDAAGIAQVHVQSWRETYAGLMPAAFLARMTGEEMRQRREVSWRQGLERGTDAVIVAEQDARVVAFASAGAPRDHPGYDAELFTLYALRGVQGRGTSRALFQATVQAVAAQGACNLALWVLDVNPARRWYARQGAREAGEKTEGELREIRLVWDTLAPLP